MHNSTFAPSRNVLSFEKLPFGALGKIDRHLDDPHVMAQRENGHLGFQLKPAAQGWEIFHEAAAERPVAGHDVGERGPEEAVYGGPDQIVPQRMEILAVLPLVRTVRQPVADHHVRPAVEHGCKTRISASAGYVSSPSTMT